MAVAILKYPLEKEVWKDLLTKFKEKIEGLQNQEIGAGGTPQRQVFDDMGGGKWCDANRLALECASEATEGGPVDSKIGSFNDLNAGLSHAVVDWVHFSAGATRLQKLLNRCISTGSLIVEVEVPNQPDWMTAGRVLVEPGDDQPPLQFEVTDKGVAHYQAQFDAQKGKLEYSLVAPVAGSDLYELVMRLAFCHRGTSVSHPLFGLWEPWKTNYRKTPPIVKGAHFWGWRSDKRAPEVIFKVGFVPKLESRSPDELKGAELNLWNAVCDAYTGIRDDLNENLAAADNPRLARDRVCIRYGKEDLCLSTSIAVATCFAGAVVFPLDTVKKEEHANAVAIGEEGIINERSKTIYVYAIRKPLDHVHDTGHVQHVLKQPWPEVAIPRVDPDEILFAVKVKRLPEDQHNGSFRVCGVTLRRSDNGEPGRFLEIADRRTCDMLEEKWPALWPCLSQYLPVPIDKFNLEYQWTKDRPIVRYNERIVNGRTFEVGCAKTDVSPHVTELVPMPTSPTHLRIREPKPPWTLEWTSGFPCKVIRKSQGEEDCIFNPGQDAQYLDTTAKAGVNYMYHVKAYNQCGTSEPSFMGKGSPPLSPAGLNATAHNRRVSLIWLPSNHAQRYRLERTIVGTLPVVWDVPPEGDAIDATSFTDIHVNNSVQYRYRAAAWNGNGWSEPSEVATAKPHWWPWSRMSSTTD